MSIPINSQVQLKALVWHYFSFLQVQLIQATWREQAVVADLMSARGRSDLARQVSLDRSRHKCIALGRHVSDLSRDPGQRARVK